MEIKQGESYKEGTLTRRLEEKTASLQSADWLGLAVGSMLLSAVTGLIFGKRPLGNFFGIWVPSLMLIGVYNKIVKLEARMEREMLH